MNIVRNVCFVPLFLASVPVSTVSATRNVYAASSEVNSSVVRITEVDIGATVVNCEAGLKPFP